MMYNARGGLLWGQMRGVICSQAGLHPPKGGLYNIPAPIFFLLLLGLLSRLAEKLVVQK